MPDPAGAQIQQQAEQRTDMGLSNTITWSRMVGRYRVACTDRPRQLVDAPGVPVRGFRADSDDSP